LAFVCAKGKDRMFDNLTERLGGVFDKLTGRGALSEKDVDAALREIRVALIEADVALPVVKDFISIVRDEAVGEAVTRSVTPGQQVIKVVHDGLVRMLGGEDAAPKGLELEVPPPAVILMAGLQGSGKTTTAGKLALRLRREKKRVLLASLDTRRPAAMDQLKALAAQTEVDFLPIVPGQTAVDIARRALQAARLGGQDVLILDTAGRTSIDEALMDEAAAIAAATSPNETLLVADALTGQDAVETARRFNARLPLTGLILTRIDGDGRGGAALSMRAVTGLPIKFLGTGEKLDGLEVFDARRLAGRILGQGDVVSLVEKAAAEVDAAKAERLAKKMAKGKFDLEDYAEQLRMLQNMGGLGGIMGMLPGVGKMKQAAAGLDMDGKTLKRQEAIILSMTPEERKKPDVINGSRRRRIAKGSGVDVPEVNRLLKVHRQMSDMMKRMGKAGGMRGLASALGGAGGGFGPGAPDPGALAALRKQVGAAGKGALPGLPGMPGASPKKAPATGNGDEDAPFLGGPLGPDGLPLYMPRGKK
jgi:signal recognition particle subunit SRP54